MDRFPPSLSLPFRATFPGFAFGLLLTMLGSLWITPSVFAAPDYRLFESDQVRPLAMSSNGKRLYALNTPDGRLEIFNLSDAGIPLPYASVSVGMEPVAVAVRNDNEVWVVNQLSDSVSIVDVSAEPPRVVRTLHVGDEPRDIVFAGAEGDRAFITTAHRGQNTPHPGGDFALEGTGRADVWVFDANNLGESLGGVPLTILNLFGDRPRALAVTPDGSTVYAAIFRSGNQTTVVDERAICDGDEPCATGQTTAPGGLPFPKANTQGIEGPTVGLIVGVDPATGQWQDELGRDWSEVVRFNLPDLDVFRIDANADVPVQTGAVPGVGTVLFNMEINPATGRLYVTNTEANNRVRFEGHGDYVDSLGPKPSGAPASVRGNLARSRITIIDESLNAAPRHLNKHLNYEAVPQPIEHKNASIATPMGMAFSSDGKRLYVAGYGSNAISVYDALEIESDTFSPLETTKFPVSGGGPTAVLLDEERNRLYVLSRYKNWIQTIDADTGAPIGSSLMFNPEPPSVQAGRKVLYDAELTSSNGEASCSSCHVFADMDDIAWDLGNPDGLMADNPNPAPPAVPGAGPQSDFHPLKGPMTTQSLRGMATAGAMHWRGDKTGASTGGDPFDANAAFLAFNGAFGGVIGRDEGPMPQSAMQSFADFALQLAYPPNPIRNLDNSLNEDQAAGEALFFQDDTTTGSLSCVECHTLDRDLGHFGTDGTSAFIGDDQDFKIPHLRNLYQKVGMFGGVRGNGAHTGDQVRGSGYGHDGVDDHLFRFLSSGVFDFENPEKLLLAEYLMTFETDFAPMVGQQVTLSSESKSDALERFSLMAERALTPFAMPNEGILTECDMVLKGVVDGEPRGWLLNVDGAFLSSKSDEDSWTMEEIIDHSQVAGQEITATCVPPGSGIRSGLDRDRDGIFDSDDLLNTINCGGGEASIAGNVEDIGGVAVIVLGGIATAIRRRRRSA